MAPDFHLTVIGLKPPLLPHYDPTTNPPIKIQTPLNLPPEIAAQSSLAITISRPTTSPAHPKNPLYPATHLQLSYGFAGTGEVFVPSMIRPRDLLKLEDGSTTENIYQINVSSSLIPRAKVNRGTTSTAEVMIHVWKGEKLLGTWFAGRVANLGIVGWKEDDLAVSRVEAAKRIGKLPRDDQPRDECMESLRDPG